MPTVNLDVYLFFTGNCRQAMEFYKSIFGGELTLQTYDEVPAESMPPAPADMPDMTGKVMHAQLKGGAITLMASDSTRESFGDSFISLSLGGTDEAVLQGYFDKLAEGGKVTSPLKKEFWGDTFGTLTDQFGVDWMVNISSSASTDSAEPTNATPTE